MGEWTDPDPQPPQISHQRDYFSCLTPEQRRWCEVRLGLLQREVPMTGDRLRRRKVGLRQACVTGRAGNAKWGWRMWGINRRRWQEKRGTAYRFSAADHAKAKLARELKRRVG